MVREAEENQNVMKLIKKDRDIAVGSINSCCFLGNNILATGSGDKLVRIHKVCGESCTLEELNSSSIDRHTYPITHVDFNGELLLASSSMEGTTNICNFMTGELIASLSIGTNSVRVCKFNLSGNILATAGDDDIATLWDCTTFAKICDLVGHLGGITCLRFSPDSKLIMTTSNNEDFRIWSLPCGNIIYIKENAHDLGIQGCDISENLQPIPYVMQDNVQHYLAATCGVDRFVKLWKVSFQTNCKNLILFDTVRIKCWRILHGHGGTVICVLFSPGSGEILCSTSIDGNARIWSVYSGNCLHVLDHDSIVTCCSFSKDCSLLATSSLDSSLYLWKLPQELIFRTVLSNKLKIHKKSVLDWTKQDTANWFKDTNFGGLGEQVMFHQIDGRSLCSISGKDLQEKLEIDDEQLDRLLGEIKWLKMDRSEFSDFISKTDSIPDEFFCPITHDLMMEPVTASDGFSYEKSAITEWFLSGKCISPMTNETLKTTDVSYNNYLRGEIHEYLNRY